MTGGTPTTEEIRKKYSRPRDFEGDTIPNRMREFDRWLNEIRAKAWDKGHGYPCDKWIRSEMCREYHPNPYRPTEK